MKHQSFWQNVRLFFLQCSLDISWYLLINYRSVVPLHGLAKKWDLTDPFWLDGSSWQPCVLQHLQYPPGKTGKTCNLCTYLLSYYCLLLLGGTLSRTSEHLCRWYLFVNCWHFVKSAVQSWSLQRLVYTAWSGVQTSEWRLWSENPVMLGQHL